MTLPPLFDISQPASVGGSVTPRWPQGQSGRIYWHNDSPYGHYVGFNQATPGAAYYVPAFHSRLITTRETVYAIVYNVPGSATLNGAVSTPISLLTIEYYPLDGLPGVPDGITPLANRLQNVGNVVSMTNVEIVAFVKELHVTDTLTHTLFTYTNTSGIAQLLRLSASVAILGLAGTTDWLPQFLAVYTHPDATGTQNASPIVDVSILAGTISLQRLDGSFFFKSQAGNTPQHTYNALDTSFVVKTGTTITVSYTDQENSGVNQPNDYVTAALELVI